MPQLLIRRRLHPACGWVQCSNHLFPLTLMCQSVSLDQLKSAIFPLSVFSNDYVQYFALSLGLSHLPSPDKVSWKPLPSASARICCFSSAHLSPTTGRSISLCRAYNVDSDTNECELADTYACQTGVQSSSRYQINHCQLEPSVCQCRGMVGSTMCYEQANPCMLFDRRHPQTDPNALYLDT